MDCLKLKVEKLKDLDKFFDNLASLCDNVSKLNHKDFQIDHIESFTYDLSFFLGDPYVNIEKFNMLSFKEFCYYYLFISLQWLMPNF
ncbi:MAG: hypothetical protein ABDH37_07655 [Candidatus Hydrothermales bacterium]